MSHTTTYPKVKAVKPLDDKQLLITFEGEIRKIYNCKPLLYHDPFTQLNNDVLFKLVQVDPGGYGISWNDEIDLSEAELWLYGQNLEGVVAAMDYVSTKNAEFYRRLA